MAQEDTAFGGSPFQHGPVIRTGHTHVLNAHDVEIRPPAEQSAHDVAIEVFVRGQSKHERAQPVRRAINLARTPSGSNRDSF
jgi:hypothetical protein